MTQHSSHHTTERKKYIIGYVLSLLLTLATFASVQATIIDGWALRSVLVVLAVVQLIVQLVYFLHISVETKPRWKLLVLLYTIMTVVVIVLGSMWIMYNLDYNHTGHNDTKSEAKYIIEDEGFAE